MVEEIRDRTAITGVGMTPFAKASPQTTALSNAVEGFKRAITDAGIGKTDVDGLIMMSFGADYDRFLETLGLDVAYVSQGWHHGRFMIPMVQQAAMVIAAGLATTVAIVHGSKRRRIGSSDGDPEIFRQGLGPHGESAAYGAVSRAFGAAITTQRYFHLYGGDNAALAPVATTLRYHASLNPNAFRRDPITEADHQASRWIVEPLRLLDCCQINEGGIGIIVTSAERAAQGPHDPVYVSGMQGVHAGPNYLNFALPGLGAAQQDVFTYQPDDLRVYEQAEVRREEIDGLTVYDAFTPLILFSLERFGFCGPGEAMAFVKDGGIRLGGALPVNTSGGLHSEGHLTGWNLLIEMVRQLRHECADRQIPDAQVLQWGSFLGESLILKRTI